MDSDPPKLDGSNNTATFVVQLKITPGTGVSGNTLALEARESGFDPPVPDKDRYTAGRPPEGPVLAPNDPRVGSRWISLMVERSR